jgi:lipopolysaccharide export system permease protein
MILVRYVLKEHIIPFFAALFVITFLFVIDFLVNILDSVLSKGLPAPLVLEIFVLNLAWMLALAIPMAVLVSTLMAFGRLSADLEITAVKAAGISPLLLMRPVLLIATLFTVLLIVFNNWVLPEANHRAAALMQAVSRKKPHAFIDEGKLITQFPGVQLWISDIDPVSGTLFDVQIFEIEGKGPPRVVVADSASMEYIDNGATLMLRLHSGENHFSDPDDPRQYFRIRFAHQDFAVRNVDDRVERRERNFRGDREMPIEMMLDVVQDAQKNYERLSNDNGHEVFSEMISLAQQMRSDTVVPVNLRQQKVKPDLVRHEFALREITNQERNRMRLVERVVSRLEAEQKKVAQYWVEIHKKISTSVACLVFVLIGAPLGIMARRGGIGTGVVYSLFFFVIYWVGLIGGENLADRLIVSPAFAMWAPNVLIGLGGLFITWRMARDNYSGNTLWSRIRIRLHLRRRRRQAEAQ